MMNTTTNPTDNFTVVKLPVNMGNFHIMDNRKPAVSFVKREKGDIWCYYLTVLIVLPKNASIDSLKMNEPSKKISLLTCIGQVRNITEFKIEWDDCPVNSQDDSSDIKVVLFTKEYDASHFNSEEVNQKGDYTIYVHYQKGDSSELTMETPRGTVTTSSDSIDTTSTF